MLIFIALSNLLVLISLRWLINKKLDAWLFDEQSTKAEYLINKPGQRLKNYRKIAVWSNL